MNSLFIRTKYVIRKKVFSLLGTKYHIYDENNQLVLYSEMKAFKFKEDIGLYKDETMSEELLRIRARSMVDFSATYDVTDSVTGEKIGALRRRGFKSILKDEWIILAPDDSESGRIKEDNSFLALLRRFIHIIPQSYHVEIDGHKAPAYTQNINPLVTKVHCDFSQVNQQRFDPRLGLAAGILLCSIEGKQD
ncbi:hypothetical protein [Paenibacillus physcomitrellae]|uniref:Uncharacterized protein n=1 Tax=Paenibacillus physcomitrellae TaxID=1619311 RepID=A0ABQ1GK46_9BACL|nr:hypothetical protein [Paenibacillus physcomitrellae]GGA45401.1 hypothetical protein GCM10010917_33380 [Paenibacillus physcomitrellae]